MRVLETESNPILGGLLRDLRDVERQRDRGRFRANIRQVGTFLAYEIGKTLKSETVTVRTPLGERRVETLASPPVLATALRAGIPLLDGFLEVFRDADVAFFGAARKEDGPGPSDGLAMDVHLDYEAMVPSAGRTVIFVDPMVATGSTIIDIHRLLAARGQAPKRFIVAAVVGYTGAVQRLEREIPGLEVWFATADETLDERGYIVPGLGDAGDLCFGSKVRKSEGEKESSA